MHGNESLRLRPRWALVCLGLCLVLLFGATLLAGIVQGRSSSRFDFEDGGRDGNDNNNINDNKNEPDTGSCTGITCELRSTCGKAPLNPLTPDNSSTASNTPFVVNGQPQIYGEWPSYVKITVSYYSRQLRGQASITCGGVLVSNKHVLTAAHCQFNPESGMQFDVKKIMVTLGDHLTMSQDKYERYFQVESSCVSSKYSFVDTNDDSKHVVSDFAVLTLKKRVPFNKRHQPACLPYDHFEGSEKIPCYLVGQGATGLDAKNKRIPAKVVMKMPVRHASCSALGFYEDESRVCYAKKGSDGNACMGDSGGPILCLEPKSKRWTVVGTVSYGTLECKMSDVHDWIFVAARTTTLLESIKNECKI